jgi:alkylation response protein AidB-like acyl-CoA dehydrogenase
MWSSGAIAADFGLCLCRSDWSVPKHQGLTMVAVPLQDTPGLTVRRTRAVDGEPGNFCEEFFDDVVVPEAHVIGAENDGWSVAHSLLRHERDSIGGIEFGYGYLGGPDGQRTARRFGAPTTEALVSDAVRLGTGTVTGHLLADAYIDSIVVPLTSERLMTGLRTGTHQGQWGSVGKVQSSSAYHEAARTALAVHGADGVIWDGDDDELEGIGTIWLGARRGTIAGGTSEIQRNIISERLLGLPREPAADRDRPYGEVVRGTGS